MFLNKGFYLILNQNKKGQDKYPFEEECIYKQQTDKTFPNHVSINRLVARRYKLTSQKKIQLEELAKLYKQTWQ